MEIIKIKLQTLEKQSEIRYNPPPKIKRVVLFRFK